MAEFAVDTHGNALCERCHSAYIFYADSERFCQSCLLAIESEYDAKIAREEAQSLYNSDSGVDAEDYRAHIDAFAPELISEPTPSRHDDTEAMKDAAIQQVVALRAEVATLRAENATLKQQLATAVAEDMARAYIDAETEHFEPYFTQQMNAELDALKTALQTALTHLLRNSPKNAQYVLQQALNK
jgi:hypothetical protein